MLTSIILASIFVSLSSLVGIFLLLWKNLLTQKVLPFLVSFAAGVILTVSFFDLLPEAVEHAEESGNDINIFAFVFSGIILFFFLERFLLWYHHHDEGHGEKPTAILILFGDGFHNFIDGVIIASTFILNPTLGVVTTLAIIAHEIPHEIADFSILIHSGMKKFKALLFNFLSSLTALFGAIGGYFYLKTAEQMLPVAIAFSAGTFIYIACSDLIPDLHKDFKEQRRWGQSVLFIIGILIAYFAVTLTHSGH